MLTSYFCRIIILKKMKMKKNLIYAASILMLGVATSCKKEIVKPPVETNYSGVISKDVTWTNDNVYTLDGRVVVANGVTLTIEAGTIIKAKQGQEAEASVLIIARGGKINAKGTASEPIIFTSELDELTNNHANYPGFANLDETMKGLWGGVLILGKAPISADASEMQIEGIPASDVNGLYGGNDATDNSGTFQYVQIRHGGTLIGEGNEINGLTLGGVGSSTVIENIEIIANVDDGIECFGGTVNVKNILVWAQGDDAFDIDQSYAGTIDNFMYFGDAESDHGLEIDGPEGAMEGSFHLKNGTMKGYFDNTINGEYADFRDGALGTVENVYFYNFSCESDLELDASADSDNAQLGKLNFVNLAFNISHLDANACNVTIDDICLDNRTDGGNTFSNWNAQVVTIQTTGADKNKFLGWTCADLNSVID